MVEMSKKCVKKGENPNIPYPLCERSIKICMYKGKVCPARLAHPARYRALSLPALILEMAALVSGCPVPKLP